MQFSWVSWLWAFHKLQLRCQLVYFLEVQWLWLHAPNPGVTSLILGQGTKILHAEWCGRNKTEIKQKDVRWYCSHLKAWFGEDPLQGWRMWLLVPQVLTGHWLEMLVFCYMAVSIGQWVSLIEWEGSWRGQGECRVGRERKQEEWTTWKSKSFCNHILEVTFHPFFALICLSKMSP